MVEKPLSVDPLIAEIRQVVDELRVWAEGYGSPITPGSVGIEDLGCPHIPLPLPAGCQGLYGFNYQGTWLKIGIAGPATPARWRYHHYNPLSSNSNLAVSLIRYGHLADREDVRVPTLRSALVDVYDDHIKEWIKANLRRVNVLLPSDVGRTSLLQLEAIAHSRLQPVFEQTWKFGGPSGKEEK